MTLQRDPFLITGPACISFSGGRTSAYMLHRILDVGLQPDVHVVFANTGKERPETLDFVRECQERWDVPVRWVEWRADAPKWAEVDYATASRNGEPFEALIKWKSFLPNPAMRFCTIELKVRVIGWFMRAQGYDHWTNLIGIRYDEPRRAAKTRAPHRDRWENECPLFDARVTLAEVTEFWERSSFDLQLQPWEGNCDACFLKARWKKERVFRDRPDLAEWWMRMERETSQPFRARGPDYSQLLQLAIAPRLFTDAEVDGLDDLGDCFCGD